MRRGAPCNVNRFFPVRITTQGKPCSGPVLALYEIAVPTYYVLGSFLIFLYAKIVRTKITYSGPHPVDQKHSNFRHKLVQKFQINSITLPTLLVLQTICVHFYTFFSISQRKLLTVFHLVLHYFPTEARNNILLPKLF